MTVRLVAVATDCNTVLQYASYLYANNGFDSRAYFYVPILIHMVGLVSNVNRNIGHHFLFVNILVLPFNVCYIVDQSTIDHMLTLLAFPWPTGLHFYNICGEFALAVSCRPLLLAEITLHTIVSKQKIFTYPTIIYFHARFHWNSFQMKQLSNIKHCILIYSRRFKYAILIHVITFTQYFPHSM